MLKPKPDWTPDWAKDAASSVRNAISRGGAPAIGPRVYLVAAAMKALIPEMKPYYDFTNRNETADFISQVSKAAVDLADATLDRMVIEETRK
jgi:hypothetical protein